MITVFDLLVLVWVVILLPILCVSVYDWYNDFFNGMHKVEVTHKDGKVESFMYNSKERRMFLRTMKKYKVKEE